MKSPSIWSSGYGMFSSSVCTCTHTYDTNIIVMPDVKILRRAIGEKTKKASGRTVVLNWLLARCRAQVITVMPDVKFFRRTIWEKSICSMVSWLSVTLNWWLECQMLKFKEEQIKKKHQKSIWQGCCAFMIFFHFLLPADVAIKWKSGIWKFVR
jgi:hypothetical protein